MTREKVIFYGQIDGTKNDVLFEIEKFRFENFTSLSNIDARIEYVGNKQVWFILPPKAIENEKILNGYIEVIPISSVINLQVELHIISCREVLDLLFFQMSQRLQARFIIPNFPPEAIITPWKELIAQGIISPKKTLPEDILNQVPDPDEVVGKYGTHRDLTTNEVRRLVRLCKNFQKNGGTVEGFYDEMWGKMENPPFTLDTFIKWTKNAKFLT